MQRTTKESASSLIRWTKFSKYKKTQCIFNSPGSLFSGFILLLNQKSNKHQRNSKEKSQEAVFFCLFQLETSSSAPGVLRLHQISVLRKVRHLAAIMKKLHQKNNLRIFSSRLLAQNRDKYMGLDVTSNEKRSIDGLFAQGTISILVRLDAHFITTISNFRENSMACVKIHWFIVRQEAF